MEAALEAMHTRMYALLRWRTDRTHLSEFLEHLASDNGADIHKYNTSYTDGLSGHVLTPESIIAKKLLFFYRYFPVHWQHNLKI